MADLVKLWKAPSPSCLYPEKEVREGFDPVNYPGLGVFLATEKSVAEGFEKCYEKGLQEIPLSQAVFDTFVKQGILQADLYYPFGQAWHVPEDALEEFNEALKSAGLGQYHPQK